MKQSYDLLMVDSRAVTHPSEIIWCAIWLSVGAFVGSLISGVSSDVVWNQISGVAALAIALLVIVARRSRYA